MEELFTKRPVGACQQAERASRTALNAGGERPIAENTLPEICRSGAGNLSDAADDETVPLVKIRVAAIQPGIAVVLWLFERLNVGCIINRVGPSPRA